MNKNLSNLISLLFKKLKILIVLLIVFTIYVSLSVSYSRLIFDDPSLLNEFDVWGKTYGFFNSILMLARNADINQVEYRTYWIPKIIHFLLFQIFNYNSLPYVILTFSIHALSSIVLYKILFKLLNNKELSYYGAVIWLFNPFCAPLYIFHHFGYQSLPVYFYFILLLYNLKKRISVFDFAISTFLIFLAIFSGENIIPIIIFTLTLFLLKRLINKDYFVGLLYLGNIIFTTAAITIHYLWLSSLKTNHTLAQRFHLFSLISISQIFNSVVLWLKQQFLPTLFQTLYIRSSDYNFFIVNHPRRLLIATIIIIALLAYLFNYIVKPFSRKNILTDITLKNILLLLIFIPVSMYSYLHLVITGGSAYFVRYGFLTGPVIIYFFVLLLFYFIKFNNLSRNITWLILSYIVLLFAFTQIELKPKINILNTSIESFLLKGKGLNKKAVLISHTLLYPSYASPNSYWYPWFIDAKGARTQLINPFYTGVQSPYKFYHSLNAILINNYKYETVSFSKFKVIDDKVILTDFSDNKKVFKKNEILILGNSTLDYNYSDFTKQRITPYYNWSDFQNSSSYSSIKIFSNNKESYLKFSSVPPDYLFAIDMGDNISHYDSKIIPDGKYGLYYNNVIYGQTEGVNGINSIKNVNNSSYLTTNRYGSFVYRINNLEKKQYWISFDFLELWHSQPNQRIFSLTIKSESSLFTIGPIDLFKLDPNKGPISIMAVTLPTDFIEISTNIVVGSKDVPFISGIRLYDHPILEE